ncbi:eukaryotic translation initiation factor 2A-like [Uloborus diversus]|uniref:eukaryotic translation initiation factor 2A-like n=1 Tax=Uloborus diversus TaxID=327109 RepID=UPI00240A2546|nr:eukaryotic translation initiation factor 2A-like [Uloborus diversus]
MPNEELFDIRWKPVPEGYYKAKPTTYTPVRGIQSICPATSKEVYRPPGALGKPSTFKLHEDESPASKTDSSNAAISKNKKKNMARKAKKNENNAEIPKAVEDLKPPVSEAPAKNDVSSKTELTGDPEKDKKIRSLLKKLDQIEKLKKDQAAGKKLELNQLEKIKKAVELEEELSALQLN